MSLRLMAFGRNSYHHDRLEAAFASAGTMRRRLLDALLAEALAPVRDRATEAAE